MMMTLYDEEQIMKNHDATLVRETAISSMVRMCKRMGGTVTEAIQAVVEDCGYSEAMSTELVQKYWNE
jgi:hypothetical protein